MPNVRLTRVSQGPQAAIRVLCDLVKEVRRSHREGHAAAACLSGPIVAIDATVVEKPVVHLGANEVRRGEECMSRNHESRRNHQREGRCIGDLDADSRHRGNVDRDTRECGRSIVVERAHGSRHSADDRVVHVEERANVRSEWVHRSTGERSSALVVVGGVRKVPAEQRKPLRSRGHTVVVAVELLADRDQDGRVP